MPSQTVQLMRICAKQLFSIQWPNPEMAVVFAQIAFNYKWMWSLNGVMCLRRANLLRGAFEGLGPKI